MEKVTTSTPHDALFKQFLSHPETARDFLDIHLPRRWRALCDLDSLTLEPASFIKKDLRAFHSDIIWSVSTQAGKGYIYVVIEHQSTPDKLIAFRLLRYAMEVMQRHLDKGHTTLPLVVPMLFYHGSESPCPHSLSWFDEFADPVSARQLYSAPFPLVDITATSDAQIMQHRRIALLELVQKHIRQRDLLLMVEQLASLLAMGYTTAIQRETLFNYLVRCGDAPNFSEFFRQIAQRSPQYKEEMMTIAERLHEAGRKDGQREGFQEGRQEEALRIARTMLENGIARDTILKITGLSAEKLVAHGI